jgi:hypothetical protein
LRDYLTRCRDPITRDAGSAELLSELDAVARAPADGAGAAMPGLVMFMP